MSGNDTSSIRQLGTVGLPKRRYSPADSNATDAILRDASKSEIASRTLKSSSTMMTNSAFPVIPRSPQRQRERKYRPLRLVITHSQRSIVSLNNGAADRKADAQAVWFGAVKRLKCLFWMPQSGTIVVDLHDYAFIRTLRAND